VKEKETPKVLGPGEYRLDPSLQIKRVEDLPKPVIVVENRVQARCACPTCGALSPRTYTRKRKLYDIGDLVSGRPRRVTVMYSQHRCEQCGRYFSVDTRDLAEDKMLYTRRVMNLAIHPLEGVFLAVVEDRLPYREASKWPF